MRPFLRFSAVLGAIALGAITAAPAVAATDNQAGASALWINVANQGGQGTGTVTATYADGKETKTGDTQPAFPQPAQDYFKAGVLEQEATASPGYTAACAGLGGHGKGQITIGDGSCLEPGNVLTGSFSSFDLGSIFSGTTDSIVKQLPSGAQTQIGDLLTQIGGGSDALATALDPVLSQLKTQFGQAGVVANLGLVEGRCTAGDGGPTGSSKLSDANLDLKTPDGTTITLLDLPVDPPPNTHLTTNLSQVLNAVLAGIDTQLTKAINGSLGGATEVTKAIHDNIVEQIRKNAEANFKPLEDNVLDVVLNEQEHPTADSIKVRALHAKIIPAAAAQVGGSLVDLQIGGAACAPVARTAAVSAPQAAPHQSLPTSVSAGLATAPGQPADEPNTGIALAALAIMLVGGTALVAVRWLHS